MSYEIPFLLTTTIYQLIACHLEGYADPPGKLIDVGGYRLHIYGKGERQPGAPAVVFEHSLGGCEGYLLIDAIAKFAQVYSYDRAGYGWSDHSLRPRTSEQIVNELDILLTKAKIQPPYILVGESFGTYNMRLYADRFPTKVVGLVLTDGLHESELLKMSRSLRALQLFFASGFVMSVLGSALGIVRLIATLRGFELIKPQLRQFAPTRLRAIKRSFCRPKHWITMTREILSLDASGRQVSQAQNLGSLPIISIKAGTFFHASIWTRLLPIRAADRLRDQMHHQLLQLSTQVTQVQASQSSHFVWVDQPEVVVAAVKTMVERFRSA
jgi:pimeloyl-ACP methyl ester carboxylesterase